ncbi:MAG: DUF362 domain-containing protein [bacterium]|nr:MAG: DUF362 domain-containing protein [bacterium]
MFEKMTRRTFIKKSAFIGASSLFGMSILSRCTRTTVPSADITVVKGDDYLKSTVKAVDNLGGMGRFVPRGSRVAILANPQRNNPGAFTKPEIVRAAIRMCKDAGAEEISCLSWLPEQNWEATGVKAAVVEEGANLIIIDLKDETLFKPVQVPNGVALKEARIMQNFFDYDVFIDMPITKDHAGNKFTGTLKNLMGLNSPKNNRTFHMMEWKTDIDAITHLDQCIADLNTVISPDLCIVDATEFITTNGPFGPGELIHPQKVVAGTDRVAIDAYCATLWGLKGADIIHIQKAYEHKLGEIDLDAVTIDELEI